MTDIPVYDNQGVQVDSFSIADNLEYVNGRVYKGDKTYYKGVGVPYKQHHHLQPTDEYDVLYKCDVFYIGYAVSKKCFAGKTGVFQERHQTHFTDWIGACGEKEIQIVENLWELKFARSGIEVFGWHAINDFHNQYYLEVDYPTGRTPYIAKPNYLDLMSLMGYMIDDHWNFPWDKNSISDILTGGLVSDVADIFYSRQLKHKLGTIYSILYSLGKTDRKLYEEFCITHMLDHSREMNYVTNALAILMRHNVNIEEVMKENMVETYKNAVTNYLILGKNCGYCGIGSCKNRPDANETYGEMIQEQYVQRTKKMLE